MNTELREKVDYDNELNDLLFGLKIGIVEKNPHKIIKSVKSYRKKILQEVFEKIAEIEEKYKFQYDSEGCESCVLALQQLKQSLGGK